MEKTTTITNNERMTKMQAREYLECTKVYVETCEKSKLIHEKLREIGFHIQGRYTKRDINGNEIDDDSVYDYETPYIYIYYSTFGYENFIKVSVKRFNESTNKLITPEEIINLRLKKEPLMEITKTPVPRFKLNDEVSFWKDGKLHKGTILNILPFNYVKNEFIYDIGKYQVFESDILGNIVLNVRNE